MLCKRVSLSVISTKPKGGRAWRDFKTQQQISLEVGKKRQEAAFGQTFFDWSQNFCPRQATPWRTWCWFRPETAKRVTKLLSLRRMTQDREPQSLVFQVGGDETHVHGNQGLELGHSVELIPHCTSQQLLRRARPTHFVAIQLKSREIQRCVLLPQLCWWVWKRASSASMRNFGRAFDSFYTLSNLFHIWHLASKGTVAAMVRCSKQAFWAVFGGMLSTMSLELHEGSPPENMCKTSQSVFRWTHELSQSAGAHQTHPYSAFAHLLWGDDMKTAWIVWWHVCAQSFSVGFEASCLRIAGCMKPGVHMQRLAHCTELGGEWWFQKAGCQARNSLTALLWKQSVL